MKLETGMYVRTKDGHVDKIIKINNDSLNGRIIQVKNGELDYCMGYTDFTDLFPPSHYTKASFNIIDLIEVGDYVNGLPVTKIIEYFSTHEKYIELYGTCSDWKNEDIKSIVTKEQFESMEYRIGVE